MKHQYDFDEEIERTLQSLNGIQPASPKPFFYTRLQARMEKKIAVKTVWQRRPQYAFMALGVVLLLNFATVYTLTHPSKQTTPNAESFANEYGLNDVSSLDTN